MNDKNNHIKAAQQIIISLGLPASLSYTVSRQILPLFRSKTAQFVISATAGIQFCSG